MSAEFWATIGISVGGWIATAVAFVRKQERDNLNNRAEMDKEIALIKDRVDRCEKDFHEHEKANEVQFEKYHQDMNNKFDLVFKKIDELKDMFFKMAMNGKFQKQE